MIGVIYAVRNEETREVYVGQTTRPRERAREHEYRGRREGWSFVILEEVEESLLNDREDFWMNEEERSGWTVISHRMPVNGIRGVRRSDETKNKIRTSKKGKPRKPESVARMIASQTGRVLGPQSPEHKNKRLRKQQCGECEYVNSPGNLGRHRKKMGHVGTRELVSL